MRAPSHGPCDGGVRRGEIVALPAGVPCWYDPDWDEATSLRVEYMLPAEGWSLFLGPFKDTKGASGPQSVGALFVQVDNLSIDACATHRPLNPAVGPEVADFAEALAALAPFEVTSPPTDVTAFGYSGQQARPSAPNRSRQSRDEVRWTTGNGRNGAR